MQGNPGGPLAIKTVPVPPAGREKENTGCAGHPDVNADAILPVTCGPGDGCPCTGLQSENIFSVNDGLIRILPQLLIKIRGKRTMKLFNLCSMVIAVLVLMSVSVHPAMADQSVRDMREENEAMMSGLGLAGSAGYPEYATDYEATLSGFFTDHDIRNITTREIALDGKIGDPTASGVQAIDKPFARLEIRPVGPGAAKESAADVMSAAEVRIAGDKLSALERDDQVRAAMQNLTERGYTTRTDASIHRYETNVTSPLFTFNTTTHELEKLPGRPEVRTGLADMAVYSFTNTTSGESIDLFVSQGFFANGTAMPEKLVLPGVAYSVVAGSGDDIVYPMWGEFWIWCPIVLFIILLLLGICLGIFTIWIIDRWVGEWDDYNITEKNNGQIVQLLSVFPRMLRIRLKENKVNDIWYEWYLIVKDIKIQSSWVKPETNVTRTRTWSIIYYPYPWNKKVMTFWAEYKKEGMPNSSALKNFSISVVS